MFSRCAQAFLRASLLACFAGGSGLAQTPGDAAAAKMEALRGSRESVAKWMQSQQIISKELVEWATARDILKDRIELTKGQLESVEAKTREAEAEIAKSDATKLEALKKRDELEAATKALAEDLPKLEAMIRERHALLPVPFQDKVAPFFQRMPADPKTTKISAAERYQNVFAILQEMNKLSNDIAVVPEIRLIEGKPTEVQTIYLGLAQAYYLSTNGAAAGLGKPGEKGWEWTPRNELTKPLKDVMAVMNSKTKPHFVSLPATVPR